MRIILTKEEMMLVKTGNESGINGTNCNSDCPFYHTEKCENCPIFSFRAHKSDIFLFLLEKSEVEE